MATGPTPKCHFVPKLPNGSLEILKFGILVILEAHNFVCKPLIWGDVLKKVVALVKSFPMVCGLSPTRKEIMAIFYF
jgi:hypothetical protein